MDIYAYARAVRRSWDLVLACVVCSLAVSFVVLAVTAPVYASKVTFFASTPSGEDSTPLAGDQFGQQRVNTYVQLLSSGRLANRIVDTADVGLSADALAKEIEGKGDLNTVLFTATVRDTSASRSLAIAQAVAREFPELVQEIESQSGTRNAAVRLDVVSGPTTTDSPVSPNKKLIVLTGLLAGLALGLALAVARALLDNTVRRPEDLVAETGVPVLGSLPGQPVRRGTSAASSPRWHQEAMRALRTSVKFVDVEHPVSLVVVTSPRGGEGTSTTSAGLAVTFAEAGDRVLLVEADLRRPRVASYLGLANSVGLSNVLVGDADVEAVLQSWGSHGLKVLASGPVPPNPSELLGSPAMDRLLKKLRADYDFIILDSSPTIPVTDAVVISTMADAAIVVARYGKTRRVDVREAEEVLRAVDVRVLGTVLNRTPRKP